MRTIGVGTAGKVAGALFAGAGALGGALGLALTLLESNSRTQDEGWLVVIPLAAVFGLGVHPALCFVVGLGLGSLAALVFNTAGRILGGLLVELSKPPR